ncbi:hypothetical protein EDC19_0922 [Natranaerovirga hydrolytica]|uniref:Uncharacterized protein n=1 Tax=Natranaerovirga hydrolytica TaxID=680378 RepID=A0A4R1N0Q3_9FIRM|nr:hypothetical protein [Natranaerovirga hydrolytica]TCK98500.1 hypothetical protein EDC19_0922 [Natranaerovirga hydrolytica]
MNNISIKEKKVAENILKYLCVGSKIEGQMFYGIRILLSPTKRNKKRIKGQISLCIENDYVILDQVPEKPLTKKDYIQYRYSIENQKKIASLALRTIDEIYLSDDNRDLYMVMDNKQVLIVNGYHDEYECWQLEVTNHKDYKEGWGVVAMPKGEISYWAPEDMMQ